MLSTQKKMEDVNVKTLLSRHPGKKENSVMERIVKREQTQKKSEMSFEEY